MRMKCPVSACSNDPTGILELRYLDFELLPGMSSNDYSLATAVTMGQLDVHGDEHYPPPPLYLEPLGFPEACFM